MGEREFARVVRRRRDTLGLSQARLGDLVGRSASTIRNWERGRSLPSTEADVRSLAAVLGVDERELLTDAGFDTSTDTGRPVETETRPTMEQVYASLSTAELDRLQDEEVPPDEAEPDEAVPDDEDGVETDLDAEAPVAEATAPPDLVEEPEPGVGEEDDAGADHQTDGAGRIEPGFLEPEVDPVDVAERDDVGNPPDHDVAAVEDEAAVAGGAGDDDEPEMPPAASAIDEGVGVSEDREDDPVVGDAGVPPSLDWARADDSGDIDFRRRLERAAPPTVLERAPRGEPSYLEDPQERQRYRLRALLTAALVVVMVIVLMWSFDRATDILGSLWDEITGMLSV